ncbi:MAG: hypothetical protein ACHQU1_12390 [Gemmatimonadales bacterium]
MPAAYTIDESRSIVLSRAWGVVTDGDLFAHARTLAADPRFRPHFRHFSDFRDSTRTDITRTGLRHHSNLNPFGQGARRAIVVGSDVVYGMGRMYQVMRAEDGDELEVFRDADLAFDWLGIAAADRAALLALLAQAPAIDVGE